MAQADLADKNVSNKMESEENDEEERKHFCKVISAFRFYRLVQCHR